MNLDDPVLTFTFALAAGVVATGLARHLRVPGITLLLLTGLLLGPEVANLVRPGTLGDALTPIVGLSVAVILFEGGLQLNFGRLLRQAVTIRRLITTGALVTLAGATLVGLLVLGWEWNIALLFGTLVVVTGPTVINPITRRIRLRRNLRTILEAEGVLIDPIGAILAVVALEMILAATTEGAATGFLGLPTRLGLGLVIGSVGGLGIGALLKLPRAVPRGLENVFVLAFVLALFQASNAILPESGIMTVAIAGLVVGNMGTPVDRMLIEFKEQLTSLLVGLLFVLLAAAVPLDDVLALGWRGVAAVVALIVLVRPADVAVSTWGTSLSMRERAFLAWLAPRGIVAFAVSSLFATELAHANMEAEGTALRAMVFLVIAITVVVQGGTGGLVAGWLGVRRVSNHGFTIVGANPLARVLARALREAQADDSPLVLIDTNPSEAHAAEREGLRVVFGNANDERTLMTAGVDARRAFITLTPNHGLNLLLAKRAHESYPDVRCLVSIAAAETGVGPQQVRESGAGVLFGRGIEFERWAHELLQGRVEVEAWQYQGGPGGTRSGRPWLGEAPLAVLPLAHRRGKRADPVSDETDLRAGDIVWFARSSDDGEAVRERLTSEGWRPWREEEGSPA